MRKDTQISRFASIGFIWVNMVIFGIFLAACQDKVLVQEKTPFSASVVRLGDTIVAKIDGTSIYLSDVENTALAQNLISSDSVLTPSNPIFQRILDELIDQRLLALDALRQSLDQNDETRRRLASARERILSNVVVENLLAEKITDATILRMYEEQSVLQEKGEQVRARHIIVETEEKAKELLDLLENGGDFAALAKEFSEDLSTQDLGGDLGYFTKNALREDISSIAFSTNKGEISAPFQTKDGWHILKVEALRQTPKPKFEDIQAEIKSYMSFDAIEKRLKSLRENSNIELKLGRVSTNKPASQEDHKK